MSWTWTPYAIPLFAAAAICLAVAAQGWRKRGPGVRAFAMLLGAVALWSSGYGLELLSSTLPQKLFWARVQYVGIVLVPVAWLLFALRYARPGRRVAGIVIAALLVVPFTTLALLWNPGTSDLIWRAARIAEGPGLELLRLDSGWWFWVHTAYCYALWIAAAAVFMQALHRSPHRYRKQGAALTVALFAPYTLNVLYVVGLSPLDLTPFGLVVTGLATLWVLNRGPVVDNAPVARERIFEAMPDGVIVLDGEDRIVDLNPAAAAIIGGSVGTAVGTRFDEAFSGRVKLRDVGAGGDGTEVEALVSGSDRPRTYELRSWPLFGRRDEPGGRLMVLRDITRRKKAEEALHDSEERLRVMIEQMPAVLWATDADLVFTQMLGAGMQQLGIAAEAVVGTRLSEMFGTIDETHPAIAGHLRALEGTPTTYSVEWFGRDFECHVEALRDARGAAHGVVGVGLDVTESRNLSQRLRQSQKMEAIGRMAGGAAHDFNNLLTAVTGYAQLARQDLERLDSDPRAVTKLHHDIDAIAHAADRAASITAQLLAFSRRQVLQPRALDINEALRDMEPMVRGLVGNHVDWRTRFDRECATVEIDPVQVQQVIINLVLNARDAMPGGGTISLATRDVELTEGLSVSHDVIPAGHYVIVEIADDGFGMDARTKARLFEPFFTTKGAGKGTGLGLSTVYGIVRQTGGYIDVDSEPGEGATFRIYFPAQEADDAATVDDREREPPPRTGGSETVLLVEDEAMVRELASRVLVSNGYLVLEAESGTEALEVCRRHEGPVDLLISDVVMPGMNGSELAARVATIVPEVAVLFISGYTGGALAEHGVLRRGTNFLQKPFSPDDFVRKVREVLDQRR